MNILVIITSNDRFGDTDKPTGFWLEELAVPYYIFKEAGAELTLASPKGGRPPMDPGSDEPDARTDETERFKRDVAAQAQLDSTHELSKINADDYDAVFYPGGHGPLWDLAVSAKSIRLIEQMHAAGKPVAAVCHGPAVLRHPKSDSAEPLVSGKRVTGFTDSEEKAAGLADAVPFSLQQVLEENGASFSATEDWKPHVVVDSGLVTGQNPASSRAVAEALVKLLRNE